MRVAIPVMEGRLAVDFDDFKQVSMIDTVNQEIRQQQILTPPLIESWILLHWLQEYNVDVIIAGRMNERVVGLFQNAGIKVITGASILSPADLVRRYLTDTSVTD